MKTRRIFLSITLALSLAACVTLPAQEMSEARQALRAAETANAPAKARAEYIIARELLDQAEALLSEGQYDQARVRAREARDAALEARTTALGADQ